MVEKTDPGRDLARAGAVEIDAPLDPRFLGVAFDRRDAHGTSPNPNMRQPPPTITASPDHGGPSFNNNSPPPPLLPGLVKRELRGLRGRGNRDDLAAFDDALGAGQVGVAGRFLNHAAGHPVGDLGFGAFIKRHYQISDVLFGFA